MHPALRKGPLFLQNTPLFHFFYKKTFSTFFTKNTPHFPLLYKKRPPPLHFLPTGLSDAVAGFSVEWSTTLACTVRLPQSLGITTPSQLALRRAALGCITSVSQWTPYVKSRTCLITSRRWTPVLSSLPIRCTLRFRADWKSTKEKRWF